MSTHLGGRSKRAKGRVPVNAKGPRAKKASGVRIKKSQMAKLSAPPASVDLIHARIKGGFTLKLYSRAVGFSERAITGWEAGEPVKDAVRRRLVEFERFREQLAQVVKPDSIPDWLDTPNDAFSGLKPVEVIERGEIHRLWKMIFYLESGVAS